jgi:ferredoxin
MRCSAHTERVEVVRIEVDRDRCQGHAVCESEAPGVFVVSKDGVLTVLQESPPESERKAVEAAVKYCPTHALTIVEDET